MKGKRKDDHENGALLADGEYGKNNNGNWYARPPGVRMTANLARHQVNEHDDGTITVSPPILIDDLRNRWHGFLERGVWREC